MGCNVSWKIINKETNETKFINQTVKTTTIEAYSKDEVDNVLDKLFDKLELLFNTMKHKESGYTLKKIHHLFIESVSIKPVRGSSYIPTPEKFSNSFCGLINIKNEDNECYKWCMKYHQSKKVNIMIELPF